MDTKSTYQLGFQQLSKKTLEKTYQRATVQSRVENNNMLRKQTRNNLLLQRRNIDLKNFSPCETPERNTTTKKTANTIKPSEANSRWERLKQWKAEREKKRLEEKRKAKPIFKVYHVSASIGLPNYENVNKEIKGKPIPVCKAKVSQKTTKGPTVLKREGTFTKDNYKRTQPAKEPTAKEVTAKQATIKPDDEKEENVPQKGEQQDEVKLSEEETRPAAAGKKTKKVELSKMEPVTPRQTPRLRRQSRFDSCFSCESTPQMSARKNKSKKTIKRTPHPKFNKNNSQEKASEKSLDEKGHDALNETYSIEESDGKGNDLFEKGLDLQEPFGEAPKEKKELVQTSRFGRNFGNEVEPLNVENEGYRREDVRGSSVIKTPKKSRKNEKTPKRVEPFNDEDDGDGKEDVQESSVIKTSKKSKRNEKTPKRVEPLNDEDDGDGKEDVQKSSVIKTPKKSRKNEKTSKRVESLNDENDYDRREDVQESSVIKTSKKSRKNEKTPKRVEPLNDENNDDGDEDVQESSVIKTPKKSRKNEKTPKRVIESQITDDEQYLVTKTSSRKSSVKKLLNAEKTTNKTTKNQSSNKIIVEKDDVDIKQNDFPKESKRKSSKKLFNLEHHDSGTPNKLNQNQEKINEAETKISKKRSSARKQLNAEIDENIVQDTSNNKTPETIVAPQSKNSVKKTRTPLLTPSKIPRYFAIETPKVTPSKNSTPLVYVSPFVTISRGQYSARKEFKTRSSTGGAMPGYEETNVAAGADYFTELLKNETDHIEKVIEEWTIYMENVLPDGAKDMINVVLGQSNLLLTKKFKQFKQLIEKCKHQNNMELSVTCTDLHGYWDTMYIQIDDIKKRFKYLEKLRSNNWIEILPEIKDDKSKAKVNKKKRTKPQVGSKIKDMIKKERLKKRNSIPKRLSNVITTPSTPELMMRISQRIKHGDGITPNKSILKTDDTKLERRMTKSVLFDLTNTKMNLNDEDKNLFKINNDECESYVSTPLRRSRRLSHMKNI